MVEPIYPLERLELGVARGAFTYEQVRMAGGPTPEQARSCVFEMMPLLKKLWAGDVAHDGENRSLPSVTAPRAPCPKTELLIVVDGKNS